MKKLLGYLTTPVFLLLFWSTLLVFHPLLVIANNFIGYKTQKFLLEIMNYLIIIELKIAGTRFRFELNSSIPENRPLILVSNHQSMFDIPLFVINFKKHHPKFIAKKELAYGLPSISYTLRSMGSAIINRKDQKQAVRAISELADRIKEYKQSVCIFPEGTRARDGKIKKFKNAGLKTLIEKIPDALIVPVIISGNWEILRYNFLPIPFGTKVTFKALEPIEIAGQEPDLLCQKTENLIKSELSQLQKEQNL